MQLCPIVFHPDKYTHEVPNRARKLFLAKTFEERSFLSISYGILAYGSFNILQASQVFIRLLYSVCFNLHLTAAMC